MKAGTTGVFENLRAHPDVFMPELKELDFFVDRQNWRLGRDWYERQFEGGHGAVAVGEASPRYTMFPLHPGVPERIHSMLPDVKVVYVVRHPITRMVSHYRHRARRNADRRPIEQALREDPMYLDTSRYAFQLEQFEPLFSPEQIFVVVSERLWADGAALADVFAFIGVDPEPAYGRLELGEHNVTAGKPAPRRLTGTLMRLPGWDAVASRVAEPVKRRGRALTHRPLDGEVRLSDGLTRELEQRLAADVAGLRRYLGPSFDGWGIA